jgi:formate/nitrite transporter
MADKHFSPDAYSPVQIAANVTTVGVTKCAMPIPQTFVLAVLAGAFIAFGAMFYTLAVTGSGAGFGAMRVLGGLAFSLGLILVVVGGAELFTGNNLIAMAWAGRKVSTRLLLRNWIWVYLGNLVGSLGSVALFYLSGCLSLSDHAVAATAIKIASAKTSLPFDEALIRGVLCNTLVCLAVWLCMAARSVTDKAVAIIFPITAFVALGFEHSVANMYLIPIGILSAAAFPEIAAAPTLNAGGFVHNLAAVTLGNIFGGSVLVALVYYFVYIRGKGTGFPN